VRWDYAEVAAQVLRQLWGQRFQAEEVVVISWALASLVPEGSDGP